MYPVIFEKGPIIIFSYWFFAAIGLFVGLLLLTYLAKWKKLHVDFLYHHTFSLLFSSLILSRLFNVVRNWYIYYNGLNKNTLLNIAAIWDKGLSFWGAVIGFLLLFFYYCKREKEHFKRWLDIIVISLLAGLFFGKIGAFLDGTGYGRETSLPWGVIFESWVVKYAVPIHPTQLYAAIYILIIVLVLLFLYLKKKFIPGFIAYLGILLYSTFSFLEGFIRGDDAFTLIGIREDQMISIFLIIASTFLYLRYNKPKEIKSLENRK